MTGGIIEVHRKHYGVHASHCCVEHGCKYGCENGVCKEEPPFNWMWILLGGSIIVFCGVLYWFLRK